MEAKTCTRCRQTKPLTEFRARQSWCKLCLVEYNRAKRRSMSPQDRTQYRKGWKISPHAPAARRRWKLKEKFGITQDEYNALLEKQGHACAICGQPERKIIRGRLVQLAVDHCHRTGAIRGLLCHTCNIALGMLQDSPELLERALSYLRSHA